ncbi:hypothetical protein JOC76_001942 [Neobacillus cucumis]|nr:hypothetical protein [Neobacillus cucumis]
MNIGQGSTKGMRWCPKLGEHRTRQYQRDEVVSEVGSTSDKGRPKR